MHPSLRLISTTCWAIAISSVAIADPVLHSGIPYANHGGHELALDIALPELGTRRPAVVCIHGGGWRGGNRGAYKGLVRVLAEQGYVAVSVSYRLTQSASWPAQREDVVGAVRWLKDRHREYGVDPERIAVMGHSAGGHLSLVLGTLADVEKGESPLARAVVNYFGPTELMSGDYAENVVPLLDALVGGPRSERSEVVRDASPLSFVGRCDAPTLTFHGTGDNIVPFSQATALHEKLNRMKVPNKLQVFEGAGHGWGGEYGETSNRMTLDFLAAYLKGSEDPLLFVEDFDFGAHRWKPTDMSAWKVVRDDHGTHYSLHKKKNDYKPEVRSPVNYAVLEGLEVTDFTLDVSMRSTHETYGHQDLCLFFGYQNPSHFYYVHLGREADAHANSIFLVDGKPRVSIAQKRTDGTDWSKGWHRARVKRHVESGKIDVYFDDMQKPVMTTVDKTFTWGQVGIGSFDDIGDFDAIRLWGEKR